MNHSFSLNRRQFLSLSSGLAAIGLLPPALAAKTLPARQQRLHRAARRAADRVGRFTIREIEGAIPHALQGSVYRVAPGQNEKYGQPLRHFFDGDAFLSAFHFENGGCTMHSGFLATPERLAEQKAQKMLYHEFGTAAPPPEDPYGDMPGFKNTANVNVIHHDGRLLALSEGGPPIAVDAKTLAYQGPWFFHDSLPHGSSFTAHPKFDARSGEGFAYGIHQGTSLALQVYRMRRDGKLDIVHRVPLPHYAMIHDFAVTDNYLVFCIPPLYIDFPKLFQGGRTIGEALAFAEQTPMKLLVLRRDGGGQPLWLDDRNGMIFHNGNAFEQDGALLFDAIVSDDDAVLRLLHSAAQEKLPAAAKSYLVRYRLDPVTGRLTARDTITRGLEFPRYNEVRAGSDARFLYAVGDHADNALLSGCVLAIDLHRGTRRELRYAAHQAIEEAVFAPRPKGTDEQDGWLLLQGYDGNRDENFFDILAADSLKRTARLWLGSNGPLGFHGNFVAAG